MAEKITVEAVMAEVKRIASIAGDDERAHSAEDALWERVLFAVAEHHPDSANLALAALTSKTVDFCRWCA